LPPMSEAWSIDRCDLDQILCVGRFDLRKGADIVLKAFERALIARPALRLVLVGPDKGILEPDGSLSYFATWAATNLSAGTRDRIDYRGSVSSVEVARLRESAFSIVASRFENFAYSLAEAQAAGAPSIVSDSFGNGEIVQDGITGIVVPIADADALADAIVSLRADPERLAIMGARARERAADWLDPARVAAETADFYRRVLGNR
jgi:glycosyltransferase involved in cell wall biosynthesis